MPSNKPSNSSPGIARYPLVVILGPTASGKTEISLLLAQKLSGEIISADSRLFYRGLDIGTAKPGLTERQQVPHHLVDVSNPDETWSLADFQRAVSTLVEQISARHHLPFLVGGTGQYVRAIIEGWDPPHREPDPALRLLLETWGHEIGPRELHRRLRRVDPRAAARIEPNNLRRTVRALEVIFTTGVLFSEQRGRSEVPYELLIIGVTRPRQQIYRRADARIENMLANGWLEEVQGLLEAGYTDDMPGMSAIGYPQLAAVIRGDIDLELARREIIRLTHQYVRRQANWFKLDDPRIHWFDAHSLPEPRLVIEIEDLIRTRFPGF